MTDAEKRIKEEVAKAREVACAGMGAYVGALLRSQHGAKTVFDEFWTTHASIAVAGAVELAGDMPAAQRRVRDLAGLLKRAAAGMAKDRRLVRVAARPRR